MFSSFGRVCLVVLEGVFSSFGGRWGVQWFWGFFS